jgi:hypothetical protein
MVVIEFVRANGRDINQPAFNAFYGGGHVFFLMLNT